MSPTKKSPGVSADKPKGEVTLLWKWDELEELMLATLAACEPEMLKQLGILDPDNGAMPSSVCLPKVFELLFEYTPHIKEAQFASSSFEPTIVTLGHQAHLRDVDSARGEFTIEVPLHEHLLATLRVKVSPANALLRSKNDIFDAMDSIRSYLNQYLATIKLETPDEKRLKKQEADIVAALDALPNKAKPEEMVLVTLHSLIKGSVGSTGIASAWPTTVAKHLTKLRTKTFPSAASVKGALQVLSELGAIEPTRARQRIALKLKGRELIAALLKK